MPDWSAENETVGTGPARSTRPLAAASDWIGDYARFWDELDALDVT